MNQRRPLALGFTLVELTIVMVIVALLLGGLLLPLSAQQDIRQQSDTEKQLNEIRDALIGYAQINGHLPFPAVSFSNGTERNPAACTNQLYGFIPWSALGVRPTDTWGRLIRYRVSCNFTKLNLPVTTASTAELTVQNLTNVNDVVFVILSHGKNGYHGTSPDNAVLPGGANNPDEDTNANALANQGSTVFVSRTATPDTAPSGGFDDLVVWVPRTLLINRLVAAGKL